MEKGLAIITGADGGMGQVITAALAKEGYPVIMACLDPEKAASLCNRIQQETGNTQIEVRRIDLASLSSVRKRRYATVENDYPDGECRMAGY